MIVITFYSLNYRATKNFLLVDGCGVNTPQDIQKGQIGLVVDCEWAEALSDKIEDKKAAARRLDFQLGWYSFLSWLHIFRILNSF